ncbi:MAG: rhomboid family intramembrane serine protease [Hyphomicrobiales bacterium]
MFIPLYDGNPLRNISVSWVNWGFIVINFAFYIFIQQPIGVNEVAFSLGLIPTVVNDFKELPDYAVWVPEEATYITYAFLHGSWIHLIGNMLFLWVFGDNIEDAMGHVRYFCFYLICAAAAGLFHSLLFLQHEAPLVGASGAVAGVVAAYLILHPRVKVWVLLFSRIPLPLSAMWCLGGWVLFQIGMFAYDQISVSESSISWSAHLGGVIAGAILILFLRLPHVPLFDKSTTG